MSSIRAQFPIFAAQPQPFHYLDNAATGQICRAAADALWRFETEARANVKRGVYRLADEATNAFQHAREQVAAYVGATDPAEIVFTSGCTLAINTAAHTLAARLRPGDEILISELEHHSNIVPWQMAAERTGARVRAIPVTRRVGSPTSGWTSSCRRAPGSSPSAMPPTSPVPWPRWTPARRRPLGGRDPAARRRADGAARPARR